MESSRWRSRAHRLVGTLGVLGFLASGLRMHFGYGHLRDFDAATRLSFRSIHIYLLFASLLNLGVAPGAVLRLASSRRRLVETIGSVLVLAGPFLFGIAFLREPLLPSLDRSVTRLGIIACAMGTILMALVHGGRDRPSALRRRRIT